MGRLIQGIVIEGAPGTDDRKEEVGRCAKGCGVKTGDDVTHALADGDAFNLPSSESLESFAISFAFFAATGACCLSAGARGEAGIDVTSWQMFMSCCFWTCCMRNQEDE